ncbi:MAG: hypothetical protein SFU98_06655 [Leptospiraceae bacterium]|nr:hypothetical protein [Leptospiraceae bacterium]
MKLASLILLLSCELFSQNMINNKITEHGILNYADRATIIAQGEIKKERMDNQRMLPAFSIHQPEKETLTINLDETSVITGKKGVRLTIPANSFVFSNYVYAYGNATIYLTEIIDDFDYLTAGVNHIFYDKYNRFNYLFLGGMIKIEAFQGNNRLRLAAKKIIMIDFPDLQPGKKFNWYSIDDSGTWQLKDNFANYEVFEPEKGFKSDKRVVGVRRVNATSSGYWGFALQEIETTSLKGEWLDPGSIAGKNFQIACLGKNHRSYFMKWFSGKEYAINAFQNKVSRVFIADENGNIAMSNDIQTTNKLGYDYLPESTDNFRQQVEKISFQKIPDSAKNDLDKFREFLGLKKELYTVSYPK